MLNKVHICFFVYLKLGRDESVFGMRNVRNVGPKLGQTNKIFKPILNVIGIDAPSGSLIDNLFKEFGAVLLGNLNIKSVHINILSADTIFRNSSNISTSTTPTTAHTKSLNDKIITTILSFDDLLFNLNIRQILPDQQQQQLPQNHENHETGQKMTQENPFSMSNPLYRHEKHQTKHPSNPMSGRYLTKIDAGIKINNLTQEVNMPLLRLVHQIYSIIADSIEFDKEQNRLLLKSNQESFNNSELLNESIFKLNNQLQQHQQIQSPNLNSNRKDCWKLMAGVLELREFVPDVKYLEKNEVLDRKNSSKTKYVQILKESGTLLLHTRIDRSHISFFGSLNIKKINSKAGVNTLALCGEMNNMQMTMLFGRKIATNNRLKYEGSINIFADSTYGVLLENESKQNVVQISVKKSHMFGCLKNMLINNTLFSFIHVGQICIDVPLRPMLVHGVVYRQSKELEQNILPEIKNFAIFENMDESIINNNNNNNNSTAANQAETTTTNSNLNSNRSSEEKHVSTKESTDHHHSLSSDLKR